MLVVRSKRILFLLLLLWPTSVSLMATSLLPRADDPFWRDSIPAQMRQSYIAYGERWLGKPWTSLPLSTFADFKRTGNRVDYESCCFEKRRQLAALVMAEIIEGKGRFMSDIINGLGSFCEETWWGIPAHYATMVPQSDNQTVDLFNAETASLIAWTTYMLRASLDRFSPLLYPSLQQQIERRILIPAVATPYWWKKASMNWNPWICSNWLTCVLLLENDEERRTEALRQITQATQTFIDAYPDDGGCDEGPGYWDRAAASAFEVIRLLSAEPEYASAIGCPEKLRQMAAYAYYTYIGHDYCVNFADAHDNKAVQQVDILYPFAHWLNDTTMRQFAAYLGREKGITEHPALLYDKSGNFPALGRELFFLRHISDFLTETPREPLLSDVWLSDLQVMTARRGSLYLAMKGGTNDESHNHNDVGSLIVYRDNQPLLIDPGVGEYTSKTFSNERYTIWTMQSQYHNLPQINGIDQQAGSAYAAKVVGRKPGQLTLDIAGAYPEEAAVNRWLRSVTISRRGIVVNEHYDLREWREPLRLMFITTNPDALSHFSFDTTQLSASVEDISERLDPLLQRVWGTRMYRIILTVQATSTKGQIRYTIR